MIPSGQNHLPKFAVPEGFTLDGYFEHVVRQGYAQRLERLRQLETEGKLRHSLSAYEERLSYEIEMIKKMGYPGYFLIVWDFIRYARERGIPVGPGRGSAAGSLAAWALRITDVDPLHYDLIFERFLNPERVSLPDIDVDFCERRRGEVIEYVTQKYGRENVSQIITFGTMKAKAVIRDVGRVMDMPYADVDRIAKQIPPALDMTVAWMRSPTDTSSLPSASRNSARSISASPFPPTSTKATSAPMPTIVPSRVWPFSRRLGLSEASNIAAKSSSGSVTHAPFAWQPGVSSVTTMLSSGVAFLVPAYSEWPWDVPRQAFLRIIAASRAR